MCDYPSILALDFSKENTGCAFGAPPDLPKLFAKAWSGFSLADCAGSMVDWVPETLSVFQPDIVLLEAALPAFASRNDISTRLAYGADFLIKGCCARHGIKCVEVDGNKWKSFMLGTSRLKTPQVKRRSRLLAEAFGLEMGSHDEADAFAIWLWYVIKHTDFPSDKIMQVVAKTQNKLVA